MLNVYPVKATLNDFEVLYYHELCLSYYPPGNLSQAEVYTEQQQLQKRFS